MNNRAEHTTIRIAGKIGDRWHGYVMTEKGISTDTMIDGPVAIGPGGQSYGLKFEDITGPGEYTAPD